MIEKIEKPITPLELNNKVNEIIDGLGNAGKELFDIVQKDHILSYEETQGYELLGNYVYKTAIAGSRYGYPDFYNKVIEEYNASTSKHFKKYKSSNVTNTRLADKAGVLSGFTTSYYATNAFVSVSRMELVVKFTTGEDITTQQAMVGADVQYDGMAIFLLNGKLTVYISSNGTSWNVANEISGTHLFTPYKTYLVKYECLGEGYHKFYISEDDGQSWTEDISISSTNLVFSSYHNLGISSTKKYPFLGTIDLKGCYLIDISSNGMYNWQGCNYYEFDYVEHENGHKFYDIANKDAVDELFNSCGMAWFYGVDTANERVYLPRNVWFEQSTSDISEVGDGVDAGLPNIEGKAYHLISATTDFTGAFKYRSDNTNIKNGTSTAALGRNFSFDASLANRIYGNSDSVQPNAVKKLAYMVVGNTSTESAVTDVVDVTTSENDTIPLFHNFWSKEDMTTTGCYVNASLGGWLSGNVYTTAYNTLVQKLGTGNVKSVSSDYTDYDFVVNQDDMTFRLPLKNGKEVMFATGVKGNGNGLGVDIGNGNDFYLAQHSIANNSTRYFAASYYSADIPVKGEVLDITAGTDKGLNNGALGLSEDASKSGIILDTENITIPEGWNLYYKVSNAVQNLELLDVAGITADLNRKVNINSDVIDGQWVESIVTLSGAKTTSQTIDLSEYLPNNGYNYEVMFAFHFAKAGDITAYFGTDVIKNIDSIMFGFVNSNCTQHHDTIVMPVGTERYCTVNLTAAPTSFMLAAMAYRRIGTNQ